MRIAIMGRHLQPKGVVRWNPQEPPTLTPPHIHHCKTHFGMNCGTLVHKYITQYEALIRVSKLHSACCHLCSNVGRKFHRLQQLFLFVEEASILLGVGTLKRIMVTTHQICFKSLPERNQHPPLQTHNTILVQSQLTPHLPIFSYNQNSQGTL